MGNYADYIKEMFENYESAYKNTSKYKDEVMLEIMIRKREYEETLDKMWNIYSKGNPRQVIEYNKQVDYIKSFGLKVLRNSAGKHKIITR